MVIPNFVTRFHNVDIFDNFVTCLNCRLLTPAACKVLRYPSSPGLYGHSINRQTYNVVVVFVVVVAVYIFVHLRGDRNSYQKR